MVITKLQGGLGNQMFQYATGFALSLRRRTGLFVDVAAFEDDSLRDYALDQFGISTGIATARDVDRLLRRANIERRSRIQRLMQSVGLMSAARFIRRYEPYFCAEVLSAPKHCYLEGYWQNERYFSDCRGIIREVFSRPTGFSSESQSLLDQVRSTLSASVHIRRGDYANNPKTRAFHGLCSAEYYQRASEMLRERVGKCHFFVFSDEPEWAQQHFRVSCPTTVVTRRALADAEDMYLMSQCQHHVIANSTFSWWGAWLSTHDSKCVIAPKKWFSSQNEDPGLIPNGWIRV